MKLRFGRDRAHPEARSFGAEFVGLLLAGAFVLAILAGLGMLGVFRLDGYCYLYPGIDTRYSAGYSEAAFDKLKAGMGPDEVRRTLGEPLQTWTNKYGQVIWAYTLDGKCPWADYAWLMRRVTFKDGRIRDITKRVAYE